MDGSPRALAPVLVVLALLAAPLSASAAGSGDALPGKWVGTWRLTSETIVDQTGAPAGSLFTDTVGKLTYTTRGDVWALVGSRTDSASAVWYTGTAEVDRRAGVVVHHVQYASLQSWIGTDLVRGYRFFAHGKRLRLSAELSPELTDILEWRRAGPRWAGPL
jgi:Lipocalin-like domain